MDPHAAAQAVGLVEPRVAVPIHWGTLLPAGMAKVRQELLVDPPHAFKRFVEDLGTRSEVRILSPGESTEI
jgi:L-ascorbate metabolism protein UlaG (beta-lactamase superfamily)